MNLVQEKPVNDNNQKGLRISLIVVVILIVTLIAVAIFLYYYMQKTLKQQLKVQIDGISATDLSSNTFYITDDGKVYTSISDIAKAVGYTVYPGEYKEYTESKNSCYATNSSELVTFTANSSTIRKYPLLSDSESQDFKIDEAISERGANLYISEEGLKRAFNLDIKYNKSENRIVITTLSNITQKFESAFSEAAITKKKSGFSDAIVFNNEKALLSDLVVVKDTSSNSNLFGVSLYSNNALSTIISPRYTSVEYIEGLDDFIVKTTDNKYGIIGKDGITKVKPSYDEISEIDKNYGLYLVTSNGKPGVVNQNGKIIVYQDYDQIGLNKENKDNNVKNRYLLLNNCIPVEQNGKWGLIDKNGNQLTNLDYDAIGCESTVSSPNAVPITVIPDMDGIIVGKYYGEGNSKVMKYGIINSAGTMIVATTADSAFAVTLENKTTYYLSIGTQNIDIVDYWNTYNGKGSSNNTANEAETSTSNPEGVSENDVTVDQTTENLTSDEQNSEASEQTETTTVE